MHRELSLQAVTYAVKCNSHSFYNSDGTKAAKEPRFDPITKLVAHIFNMCAALLYAICTPQLRPALSKGLRQHLAALAVGHWGSHEKLC